MMPGRQPNSLKNRGDLQPAAPAPIDELLFRHDPALDGPSNAIVMADSIESRVGRF
jgi:hypothetical protein